MIVLATELSIRWNQLQEEVNNLGLVSQVIPFTIGALILVHTLYRRAIPSGNPLLRPVANGYTYLAWLLIYLGVDMEERYEPPPPPRPPPPPPVGDTLLLGAVRNGHVATAKMLLRKGAVGFIDIVDHQFFTPLRVAVDRRDRDMVQLLLDNRANIERGDCGDVGSTPLYAAVHYRDRDMVKLLLHGRADVERGDDRRGWTPLYLAVNNNDFDMVQLLLTQDVPADPDHAILHAGTSRPTPRDLAEQRGYANICDLFNEVRPRPPGL
jgi:ankyrin repeat protein